MGMVYRGEHVAIRRPVAIKVLHAEVAEDPTFARRFEREAFVTGMTDHPNCVRASNFGPLAAGGFYLVMELADGTLLADLLDDVRVLFAPRALHISRHVLRGLGHAHKAGIVHRDVKPSNVVLVGQEGDPDFAKILDFGVAKIVDAAAENADQNKLTMAGTTVGTPTYVAPEQAVGGAIDARSDLYSVSVMLFEMLTGRAPFEDEDAVKVVTKHLSAPVPRMSDVAPDVPVPPAVEALVRKGLEKDRDARWQSANEMIAAIDDLLARGSSVNAALAPTGIAPAPATRVVHAPAPSAVHAPAPSAPAPTTSARRLSSRHRGILAIAALVMSIFVIALVANVTDSSADEKQAVAAAGSPADKEAAMPEPEPEAVVIEPAVVPEPAAPPDPERARALAEAASLIERGHSRGAVAVLKKKLGADLANDAEAQIVLGHAQMARRWRREGLRHYRRAIELDLEAAQSSELLRDDVVSLLSARRERLRLAALEIMAKLGADDIREHVIAAALDTSNAVRHRARAIAAENGYADQIDTLGTYLLDLRYNRSCDERAKAVPILRDLGDKRAIPALERALHRRSGGFLGIGDHRANRCMEAALQEAIVHLRAQPN